MNKEELYNEVISYIAHAQLWHRLRSIEGGEDLNTLLVSMLDTERRVLQHFGLPCTLQFSGYLQLLALKDDFSIADITVMLEELEAEAILYLTSPVLTNIEFLTMARAKRLAIDDVLPILNPNLRADPYNEELYQTQFLTGGLSATDFLKQFRLASPDNNFIKH